MPIDFVNKNMNRYSINTCYKMVFEFQKKREKKKKNSHKNINLDSF